MKEEKFIFSKDCTELPRSDDSIWALPTREPEKQIDMRREPPARIATALERIADYLNNIQVLLLGGKDDGR